METTTLVLAGALVRLVALAAGAFLCWLGYRLFVEVPLAAPGDAELSGPRGSAVKLSRIGPGVFFALFGTATMIWALTQRIELSQLKHLPNGGVEQTDVGAMSGGPEARSSSASGAKTVGEAMQLQLKQEIGWLNSAQSLESEAERQAYLDQGAYLVPRIKRRLILAAWDDEAWGEPARFIDWLDATGGFGQPPERLDAAASVFHTNQDPGR